MSDALVTWALGIADWFDNAYQFEQPPADSDGPKMRALLARLEAAEKVATELSKIPLPWEGEAWDPLNNAFDAWRAIRDSQETP